METFSALLAFRAVNSPVTGEFPAQRPVTRCFDVYFDLCMNKRLSKQWWGWWFETPSRSLWRDVIAMALSGDLGKRGRLQERGFSSYFKFYGKLVLLHFKVSYCCKILHLPRQTSVVPYAQFHTSDFTTTWLKTERNFHLNCNVNRSWNGPRANKGSGHSLIFLHPFVINLSLIRSNLHDL